MVDKQPIRMSLGNFIKERRDVIEINQEELAFRVNISRRFLSDIENGYKEMTMTKLFDLADALEMNLSDMIKIVEEDVQPYTRPHDME